MTTLWHLTMNLKSVSKWVSDETALCISMRTVMHEKCMALGLGGSSDSRDETYFYYKYIKDT